MVQYAILSTREVFCPQRPSITSGCLFSQTTTESPFDFITIRAVDQLHGSVYVMEITLILGRVIGTCLMAALQGGLLGEGHFFIANAYQFKREPNHLRWTSA